MKNKLIVLTVIVISALTLTADETIVNENTAYDPGKFYNLVINSNVNVILKQGEENSISIEGEKNDKEKVDARVVNGVLIISGENQRAVDLFITVKEINLIEINGSARLYATGSIKSDVLLLKVNGNGSMKLDVRSLSLGMIVKGKGKIIISGSSGECFQRIYEKGEIYSEQLSTYSLKKEYFAWKDKTTQSIEQN